MPDTVIPIKSTTQKFTEIEAIEHDMVMYLDGSCSLVIETSAVNFGLLSEKEQEALIYSYAGLLNSLSFPIQILIRSQHKDIRAYLETLEDKEKKQKNPKIAANIQSYRLFVAETVKEKEVLDKKFYLIIPFSFLELGKSAQVFFGGGTRGLPYEKSYIFDRASMVLTPKCDHLLRLLGRLGLKARQLKNSQLIQLFFSIYNPSNDTITAEGHREIEKKEGATP
ncbi:MAG: hypothetical protein AAB508_03165 [Patescibacteria group bacterium]